MSCLRYLCLFACGVVLYFVCLRLVYLMLPIPLDCPFLIAPSIFSNVYLQRNILDKFPYKLFSGFYE